MPTEKRQPGRPKSKKNEEKAMHHGVLSGNAAKLYNALSSKTQGLSAALRMLAKSEYAAMFFDDMDAVRQVNSSEMPVMRNHMGRQQHEDSDYTNEKPIRPAPMKTINEPTRTDRKVAAKEVQDSKPMARDPILDDKTKDDDIEEGTVTRRSW